jgi:SAM-dependent methyltransferase
MKADKKRKLIHEKFHEKTKVQIHLIKKNNFTYRKILELSERYINKKTEVLDIGCGAGTICFYLANKVKKITGVDISERAINTCKKSSTVLHIKNVEFRTMNFPVELPSGRYDLIILSEVIEHIENDDIAIKNIAKLLRRNGIVLITTPSKNAPLYRMGLLHKFDKSVGHLRRYNMDEIQRICRRNGLKVIYAEKTEGILRNFLYTNPIAGKSIKFIKFFLSDIITWIDNKTIKIFGESNLYILAQKTS